MVALPDTAGRYSLCLNRNGCFVRIVLKKSVFERLVVETEEALLSLSACYLRFWDKLGELSEVLCCGCELELFVCAFGSSKSHHGQADVSLQMGK